MSLPQIKSLTSLRFFASVLIFLLHACNHNLLDSGLLSYLDLSKAVCFFFVLSGFVLTYSTNGRTVDYQSFYVHRFARIWPASLVSFLFVLVFLPRSLFLPDPASDIPHFLVFLSNTLCLQSLFPIPSIFFAFNAVAWSISAELIFYLLFPFLARLDIRGLLRVYLFFIAFSLLGSIIITLYPLPSFSDFAYDSIVWEGLLYINPVFRVSEFIIGIISGRLFLRIFRGIRSHNPRILPNKPVISTDLLYSLSFLFFFWLSFYGFFAFSSVYITIVSRQIISSIFFSIVIFISASASFSIARILSLDIFVFLGKLSFGLYLFHQPLMIRASQAGGFSIFGLQLLPNNVGVIFIYTLILSLACYKFVEIPCQRFINQSYLSFRFGDD